jgi:hypothetical protein
MLLGSNVATATEYGDYQTPSHFAMAVCEKLTAFYGLMPEIVIEPTFGIGNFLEVAFSTFSNIHTLYGIEINKGYYDTTLKRTTKSLSKHIMVELFNANIFDFDFNKIKKNISTKIPLLIIGNPPWVTNSQLSFLDSSNLPVKSNFKGYSGLEAMTGRGNFDIAEYIIFRLLSEFANYNCTLAMLCKTTVAKNILQHVNKSAFFISSMNMSVFNANEIFGVNCDAGLLVIRLGGLLAQTCSVYDFYTDKKLRDFGWVNGVFCSDVEYHSTHDDIDGTCQFEWRQGIKHDCSKVMELESIDQSCFQNGLGEVSNFQLGRYVYPLVKSSDIKSYKISQTRKYIVVPQRRINEDTSQIQRHDPAIWDYLRSHEQYLSSRRSTIYKKSPKYSIFGVGEYSFSKYKVGISGFYKKPIFALITNEIPIMLDDTCYFLSFDNIADAIITLSLLNSPQCLAFLKSVAFLDSKRPYTKEVLKRIDLAKLSNLVKFDYVSKFSELLLMGVPIQKVDYDRYCHSLSAGAPNLPFHDCNLVSVIK